MRKILLLDDDVELCELLREYLASENFAVEFAHDGAGGLARALEKDFDMMLLDVMLPGRNGFEVLRELRGRSTMPVLMLTARGDDVDRIVGLEMGADDYLPKPFNPRELVARIRAVLRRHGDRGESMTRLAVGDVVLDSSSRSVRCDKKEVDLTGVEFKLLEALMRSPGRVVPRDRLARAALDRPLEPFDRSLDVHVSNLRRKLGPFADGSPRIRTLRGEGYLFACPGFF
ncbi:MAG: Transcriptional regulatory protein OmpR [Synergistetes bacterium ADurb.Bin520]|nr:MAG: Transcriptional regulatory protein OmpR [Synergistetes bacterium ADurb.Bin520]